MAVVRRDIYELVGESSVLSLVSLFVPMILGMYWKKSTGTGAIASMIAGIGSWFYFRNVELEYPALVPATLISLVTMVTVSLMSYKEPRTGNNR
jgi:Na+/proline symporter